MADEAKDISVPTDSVTTQNPPAEAQNTVQSVPYERFKSINDAKTAAEAELAILRTAENKRKEKEALEAGKFQEVIDDLKPKAERATALEATLQKYLDAEIAEIPEEKRKHLPKGDLSTTLEWVIAAKADGLFGTPKAPNMDAGATGDRTKTLPKLTDYERDIARQRGMSEQVYAEWKAKGEATT